MSAGRKNERGFIIVAVLWILGALATLATVYAVYVIDTAVAFSTNDQRLQAESLFTASIELTAAQLGRQGAPPNGRFDFRLGTPAWRSTSAPRTPASTSTSRRSR